MALNVKHSMFPSDDALNISKEFKIEETTAMIQVKGLQDGDCMHLEYWFGTDCDGMWVQMINECTPITYCCNGTHYLGIPGNYRLVLLNEDDNHVGDPSWFELVEMQITKF